MARVDDYANAFKIGAAEIRKRDPLEISRFSAVEYDENKGRFNLEFIGRSVVITFPEVTVQYADGEGEVPLTEQVLILHYLNQAKGTPLKNEMITYREVPAGEFYFPAFVKRAEAPMLKVFGPRPDRLTEVAIQIGGESAEGHGDVAAKFQALPRVPITLVLWAGDDEFEPAGKILFDRNIADYLSTEDIAWLSGMVVYRLMRLAS